MPSIGFLGCGNMGSAIVEKLLDDGVQHDLIKVVDNHPERVQAMGLTPSTHEDVKNVEVLVVAVKPNNVEEALKSLELSSETVVLSIAAGMSMKKLASFLPENQPVCRAMPNIGVRVGAGVIALAFNEHVKPVKKENIQNIFSPLGKTIICKEKDFDTVTAIAGSGPAFIASLIEGGILGGLACGVHREFARELIIDTCHSTIELLRSGKTCEEIRYLTSSPSGTTIEGLAVLEEHATKSSIIECIKATAKRSSELGNC